MKKIISAIKHAILEYDLIHVGDKIAVGVSGGKDSMALLTALASLRLHKDLSFEICAITIDQTNGVQDWSQIENYCNKLDVHYHVVKTNIFEVVFDERKEKNPCSLCAKMRRGALNNAAKALGFNKVALAHNKEDLIETFFLSMVFEGRLSTFWPSTYLTETDMTVIRPLIFVPEDLLINASVNFPIVKNSCSANRKTQREKMKAIINEIDKNNPDAKKRIFNAIISDERYNLFDKAKKNNKNNNKN